ncbi:MAG: DNA-binding transcriptional MocR family regulator [Pseudohongiellaceae bacterium]
MLQNASLWFYERRLVDLPKFILQDFFPGMGLGYMICFNDLIKLLSRLKQSADLHSSRISQWLTIALLTDKSRGPELAQLREFYSKRRDSFVKSLDEHFADLAI